MFFWTQQLILQPNSIRHWSCSMFSPIILILNIFWLKNIPLFLQIFLLLQRVSFYLRNHPMHIIQREKVLINLKLIKLIIPIIFITLSIANILPIIYRKFFNIPNYILLNALLSHFLHHRVSLWHNGYYRAFCCFIP